jgi:hypothetical protein
MPCHPEVFFWPKDLAVDFAVAFAFVRKRKAKPTAKSNARSFGKKRSG